MWFKKKTVQQEYLDSLFENRIILDEILQEHKHRRKMLLSLLRELVRQNEPTYSYTPFISCVTFKDVLRIDWAYSFIDGTKNIYAYYEGNELPVDISEDLYKLYIAVWRNDYDWWRNVTDSDTYQKTHRKQTYQSFYRNSYKALTEA